MLALKRMNICFSSLLYDYLDIPELDYKGWIRNCEFSFRKKKIVFMNKVGKHAAI